MRSQVRGFGLVEMLIVVVVAGIVVATGLPAYLAHARARARAEARERVLQDLRLARRLAVSHRAPVVVAFGDGIAAGGATTYTLHVDTDRDRVPDAGEPRFARRMPPRASLATDPPSPVDSLVFGADGALLPGPTAGRLIVRTPRGDDTLVVSGAGVAYRP